ncbi:hypothetical protein FRB96_008514 [Tulasnella sp. 330]|nr:hypothetical protein FRB96_008514 [Tulasnella sp. 330]
MQSSKSRQSLPPSPRVGEEFLVDHNIIAGRLAGGSTLSTGQWLDANSKTGKGYVVLLYNGSCGREWRLRSALHAPPISVGTNDERFTEGRALVELHREKIDWKHFEGNAIHLGKITPDALKGGKLSHAATLDANDEASLFIVKNGSTTGVTTGRATDTESSFGNVKERIKEAFPDSYLYPITA